MKKNPTVKVRGLPSKRRKEEGGEPAALRLLGWKWVRGGGGGCPEGGVWTRFLEEDRWQAGPWLSGAAWTSR